LTQIVTDQENRPLTPPKTPEDSAESTELGATSRPIAWVQAMPRETSPPFPPANPAGTGIYPVLPTEEAEVETVRLLNAQNDPDHQELTDHHYDLIRQHMRERERQEEEEEEKYSDLLVWELERDRDSEREMELFYEKHRQQRLLNAQNDPDHHELTDHHYNLIRRHMREERQEKEEEEEDPSVCSQPFYPNPDNLKQNS